MHFLTVKTIERPLTAQQYSLIEMFMRSKKLSYKSFLSSNDSQTKSLELDGYSTKMLYPIMIAN